MKKTLLTIALMGIAGSAAAATDPLKVYGKLNVTVEQADKGASNNENTLKSNASRFGVKGAMDLDNGMQAIYQMEWEINVTDESASGSSNDHIKARSQYIGLRGDFGTVLLGRNDTMLKQAQGKVDQFNDLDGDMKHLFKGENRLGNTLTYQTPMFGLFNAGLTYITEGNTAQRVTSYDTNGEPVKYADGYSVMAGYGDSDFKKAPMYASVAYDNDVKGYDHTRVTVSGKVSDWVLSAVYQKGQKSTDSSKDYSGYLLSAAYSIGKTKLKVQYQDSDLYRIDSKTHFDKSMSVGADYKLGHSTKVFAFYTHFAGVMGNADNNYLGLGLEQKF
ncbi:porin [Gallaecimonas sp. GXIMD1310]|uniref:porin n=1 Tax=Gallaecimonas sp. GXIMD1310 TaxID=3131926 RepID=UPI0032462A71